MSKNISSLDVTSKFDRKYAKDRGIALDGAEAYDPVLVVPDEANEEDNLPTGPSTAPALTDSQPAAPTEPLEGADTAKGDSQANTEQQDDEDLTASDVLAMSTHAELDAVASANDMSALNGKVAEKQSAIIAALFGD
jgi:hypothetical protein